MKTRIATSVFVVVLLAFGMMATASEQQQQSTLTIRPLAVILSTDSSQLFEASFGDGTLSATCVWSATGVGRNGVTLTTTEKNWAVFYDGNMAGVNYVISAICRNSRGGTSSAHAYVFVR